MKRNAALSEISDGKFYRSSDLARLDTGGCEGCSACCHGMEETIVLDPYDIYRLDQGTGLSFEQLLDGHAKLKVIDGLILPVLDMCGPENTCTFLDENGWCSIHKARPGICRLFPLGRYYEGNDFRYFLQIHECGRNKAKVRIRSWLDTPNLEQYEDYIRTWHGWTVSLEHFLEGEPDVLRKKVCIFLLEQFYRRAWDPERDFYVQFQERLREAGERLGIAGS